MDKERKHIRGELSIDMRGQIKSLRQEGPNVFTAPAVLLDVNNDRKIPAEFTIDFSGTQWHVTRMRMLKAPAKAPEGEDER